MAMSEMWDMQEADIAHACFLPLSWTFMNFLCSIVMETLFVIVQDT